MKDYLEPEMDWNSVESISSLGLAHLGDGVYELLVRTWLCMHGALTAKKLHRETIERVSAPAQAKVMDLWLPLLTEKELAVFRRARNTHMNSIPRNATQAEYAKATGLEALLGYLYLTGQRERINLLFAYATEDDEHAS